LCTCYDESNAFTYLLKKVSFIWPFSVWVVSVFLFEYCLIILGIWCLLFKFTFWHLICEFYEIHTSSCLNVEFSLNWCWGDMDGSCIFQDHPLKAQSNRVCNMCQLSRFGVPGFLFVYLFQHLLKFNPDCFALL
jgi:hypothetical protein